MSDVKDIATIEAAIKSHNDELKGFITKANEEIKIAGSTAAETKSALEKISEKAKETVERLMDVEQKIARRPGSMDETAEKSPGRTVIDSPELKAAVDGKKFNVEPVTIGSFHKTAVFNATGLNQPLVPTQRLQGLITPQLRRLTVRDLLPKGSTNSNMIQYARELVYTNNAGPQYDAASPNATEGTTKPESGITFTIANEPVITVAHWIPASRQVLADAPMLQSYIDTRLIYGLKLEEEDELLNGVTANGELNGLLPQATAYNRSGSGETKIDTLRKAITQLQIAEFAPSGIVMSPVDWEAIELLKNTLGDYIWANPRSLAGPSLWGLPIVVTNAMTAGTFLIGAFDVAAQIWDREDATVRVAEQHADFFIKNMVAILAEERLALVVYRPLSFIKGTY